MFPTAESNTEKISEFPEVRMFQAFALAFTPDAITPKLPTVFQAEPRPGVAVTDTHHLFPSGGSGTVLTVAARAVAVPVVAMYGVG